MTKVDPIREKLLNINPIMATFTVFNVYDFGNMSDLTIVWGLMLIISYIVYIIENL